MVAGITFMKKPENIPQKAASFVMRLLQMLIRPTGPQLDAKTVPMNSMNQKMLGGKK